MKKLMNLVLAVFIAVSISSVNAPKANAAIAGAATYGAVPILAYTFFALAGSFGVTIAAGCITDSCNDGKGGLAIATLIIGAVIFNDNSPAGERVISLSKDQLINDSLYYSQEEKQMISEDIKLAALRLGKKKIEIDTREQNSELIVERFIKQTGVSELTAKYILAESGIQTEN